MIRAEIYNAGNFRKMMLNKEEIIKTSTKLVLFLVKTKGFK
jgi:penicillin amidase